MSESLVVNEIYTSVQGESSWVGLPCTFVRLTGCNLRCVWCDSTFTFEEGTRMTLDEVMARVEALATPLVEITGGEPLLQKDVHALIARLLAAGRTVLLETSGSVSIADVDSRVARIVDLKCPDSGEEKANLWQNLESLTPRDEVKFVVASRRDYEWARDRVRRHDLARRAGVLMGVAHGLLEPRDLVAWILEDRLPVRFQLQAHKYIWPPDARGV